MTERRDPDKEIKALEEKRDALERAIKIALNIEHLQKSLEATLLMGKNDEDLPKGALSSYATIEATTKKMTVEKLKQTLAQLQQIVKSKLNEILKIAEMDDDELIGSDSDRIQSLLNNFRRQAQTAVALRVLLHSKGEKTDGSVLQAATKQIQAKLQVVTRKEKAYRKFITSEMTAMATEAKRMMERSDISAAMRAFLTVTYEDLQQNLEHINSGKSITSMPAAVELVEVAQHEVTTLNTSPATKASPKKEPIPEVQKQTIYTPMESEAPKPKPSSNKTNEPKKKERGFFARIWCWLMTPDKVTWKETRDYDSSQRK